MNSILGTIAKAVTAIVIPVKPPIKKAVAAAAASTQTSVDPFSEMEKGRVLEWWPSQQS